MHKAASPRADTERCINCGSCLNICPTGAIKEMQRQICRLCPDCARGPVMFPRDMEALTRDSCSLSCPLGHHPEGYVNLLARGDWEGAWRLIEAVNPLPGVLGRICSRPCEEGCKRGTLIDTPLPIRAMKKELADWAFSGGKAARKVYRRNIDMKVAVAGGGPAGITAAADLASLGYRVTVFEAGPSPGGMMRLAVPGFRLPDEVWQREFAWALGDGIDVVCGATVGVSPALRELCEDGFKAVVLAIGAPRGRKLPLIGVDYQGVHSALDYMRGVKGGRPPETGEKVVVIGGGSVATDAARTALRKGAREAHIVCIEEECDMPAYAWEVEEARREGVKFLPGYAPVRIISQWMRAETLELARVEAVGVDVRGRPAPEIDRSRGMNMAVDTVIFAVGQDVDHALLSRMGLVDASAGEPEPGTAGPSTSLTGVYTAGDMAGGGGSVVEAMASGRRAAIAVDSFLSGRALPPDGRELGEAPLREKIFPVRLEKLEPLELSRLAPARALESFSEVDLANAREDIASDARRCMRCGYVEIDHALCLGCGACREICPAGDVLVMGPAVPGGEQ